MADGAEGVDVAEGADVDAIYIFIWREHHWNRPYGVMGLLSKMPEWSGVDTP